MATNEKVTEVATKEKQSLLITSNSEKFTNKVLREFGSTAGDIQVTDYQRQLIQGVLYINR